MNTRGDAKPLERAGTRQDDTEVRQLLHELQVHQAELAQQNEELRAARSDLETSLARSIALFEFAPVGLVSVDVQGTILGLNRRAQGLLGLQARVGGRLLEGIDAAHRDAVLRALTEAGASRPGSIEVGLSGSGLTEGMRTVDLQVCQPLADAPDLLVALTDTTERQRSQQAHAAQERAEAANREKSAFLARMSHELRTPLNAVLGFAHLLAREPALAAVPAGTERVLHIRDAGMHLLTLVDEVLDLSRLEAGVLAVRFEDFDAAALLADVTAMLAPLAALRPVQLHLQGAQQPLGVHADRHRTRQVLTNLVSNAIKYNRAGGAVRLTLSARPEGIAIAIADEGQGLSDGQQAGLFQPFNRVGAENSGIAGVGLGLAIARQLTKAMHGHIEVHSAPEQGSVFTLILPPAQGGELPVLPRCAAPCAPAAPLRVVYVEDNPVNATVMAALLEERPHVQLAIAADGASGLAMVCADPPDLLLLDMQLPDMDGMEFFARLRGDPRIADVPCVAVSANAMTEDVQAAIDAGMHGYLTKPIDVQMLFALIDHTPRRSALPR